MDQPVILCGLGQVGRRVLDYLRAAGVPVVVVDNGRAADDPLLADVRVVRGDCQRRETLEQAGIAGARGVLILTSNDLTNVATALMVRRLRDDVRVVVRMFNPDLVPRLGTAAVNMYGLGVSRMTAPLIALTALTGQALGTFRIEHGRYQVTELNVHDASALRGLSVGEAAARHRVVALAHAPADGPGRLLDEVDLSARLRPGDRLVVCGERGHVVALLAQAGEDVLPHLRWAGKLRRAGRIVWRTLTEVDLSVRICTSILFTVVIVSTLIYNHWMHKKPHDALFRTISVIATGADLHERELEEPWQKVFVSLLRLAGAALIAAFTAIVTNFLLRARLSGVLEVRRIPDSGHVIVCGLGHVGFRVVEELVQCGERVVVIEQSRDNKFMTATRRLGVAVVVGDATVREVLRQAHAATARAVVAATNHELANLEIGLLTRELNPKQRVVIRLLDPTLAESLRQEANIRFALSLPDLAAPAFVAAVFGDRVPSVFLLQGRLAAVIETAVQADDGWLDGQAVRALATDFRMVPVSLTTADGAAAGGLLDRRLRAGDRLTAVAALPDLQRLLRRERPPTNCAVELTGFNLAARPAAVQLLRERRGLGDAEAEAALGALPVRVAAGLTRGQAEALLAELRHEGLKAEIRPAEAIAAAVGGLAPSPLAGEGRGGGAQRP